MSSRSTDIAALLNPISDEAPCGRDLREGSSPTSNFQMLKLARSTARSAERSNIYSDDGQQADDTRRKIDESWRKIIDLAPKILRSEAKDLEVGCWYLEALVRRDGIAGLRDGFELIEGLIEQYWYNLFPMPDEYGMETRVGSLKGLNGEGGSDGALLAPIRNSIITNSGQHRAFSFWEYQSASDTSRILDDKARDKEFARKGYTLQNIEAAVRDSSSEFLTQLFNDLTAALECFNRFNDKLYQLCGSNEAPPSSAITNLLKDCITAITYLGGNKIVTETSAVDDTHYAASEPSPGDNASSSASPAQAAPRALGSREQAFKQMTEIADFFRKSEPHSPVSYLLEKAVRWGNMPLHELMQELISDETTRNRFSELTGVKGQ